MLVPRWLSWITWWRRRNRTSVSLVRETPRQSPGLRAASQALQQTRRERLQVERLGPQVAEAAASLRECRDRNHFAEAIRAALQGGG